MVNEEVLEEYGLTGAEWDVLLLIKLRPGNPARVMVQASHVKEKEFRAAVKALITMGYVKPSRPPKTDGWVCTPKGQRAITEVKSLSKIDTEADPNSTPTFDTLPPARPNEGATISSLFLMCSILGFAKECERMSSEWLQVIIMLRGRELVTGNDDGLTICELAAMMGEDYVGNAELLEDKIRQRLRRNVKISPGERWFEEVEGTDALTITLTSAGRASLDLIREDLESRLKR